MPEREHPEREVRVDDPSLSAEANRALTEDLKEAVGAERVRVPPGGAPRPAASKGGGGVGSVIAAHRGTLVIALAVLVTIGAAVSVAAGSWWFLVAALAVHAAGTLATTGVALSRLTQVERPRPATEELLESEGVRDPEGRFNQLAEELGGADAAGGAAEIISSGANERTVLPEEEPGRSAVEQRTALTPTSEPSAPAGSRSAVEALTWWVVGGMLVLSVILPLVTSVAAMWVLPAVVWPIGLGWLVLQWRMGMRDERHGDAGEARGLQRRPGDTRAAITARTAPIVAFVVIGVAVFTVIIVLLATR
jgi:hypothetical protein